MSGYVELYVGAGEWAELAPPHADALARVADVEGLDGVARWCDSAGIPYAIGGGDDPSGFYAARFWELHRPPRWVLAGLEADGDVRVWATA